jgi:replicative DNA helicase
MKAITAAALINKKFKLLNWQGAFLEAFGRPEKAGVWFIWGNSGNGKTTFAMQLIKALLQEDKAIINSLEEGNKQSMKNTLVNTDFTPKELKRIIITCEPMNVMSERLKADKSPHIALIDSLQLTGWNFNKFLQFKEEHPDKLIIFISQTENGKPIGMMAERIKLYADQKIFVQGYKAISNGRSNPGGEYTIWEQGAENYYGKINSNHEN